MAFPVLVAINLKSSTHSQRFKPIWDEVIQLYPNIRSFEYSIGNRDLMVIPKCLKIYTILWYPTILLIPGELWDKAMEDPESSFIFEDKIWIMNSKKIDGKLRYIHEYNFLQKDKVVQWLNQTLELMK